MSKKRTGKLDKNGTEIREGDSVEYTSEGIFLVKWGKGTYDSGYYSYIGFYCEDEEGDSDSWGYILNEGSELLEVIKTDNG